jgi:transposase
MKFEVESSIRLALQPVDMHLGADRLSPHVQQALGHVPCDGTAYVFSNRRHTHLKLVCWDGNGAWLPIGWTGRRACSVQSLPHRSRNNICIRNVLR